MKFATLVAQVFVAALVPSTVVAQLKPLSVQPQALPIHFQQLVPASPNAEFRLHFSGYYDARCPGDSLCVTAGEAFAFFWLTGTNIEPQVLSLPWSGREADWQQSVQVGKYRFALRSLEPHRSHRNPVAPSDYVAVVEVRLNDPTSSE